MRLAAVVLVLVLLVLAIYLLVTSFSTPHIG